MSIHHIDGVELHATNGTVGWCSAWERLDELANVGLLRRVHHGPATFGAVSFHILKPYTLDMAEADHMAARQGYNPKA